MKARWPGLDGVFFRSLGLVVFLVLWELAPRLGWVNPVHLSPPSAVGRALAKVFANGSMWPHILVSVQRVGCGLLAATATGVLLGLLVGYFRRLNYSLDLLFQTLRQLSAFALFPVIVLFFGLSETSKVVVIFWASVWPVLLNTSSGIRDVEPVLIRSAQSMGASKPYIFARIILPAATPQIFTGIRLAGSYCIMALVVAELLGASSCLGYQISYMKETFNYPLMYGAIVCLAVLGILLNVALLYLEKVCTRWRQG